MPTRNRPEAHGAYSNSFAHQVSGAMDGGLGMPIGRMGMTEPGVGLTGGAGPMPHGLAANTGSPLAPNTAPAGATPADLQQIALGGPFATAQMNPGAGTGVAHHSAEKTHKKGGTSFGFASSMPGFM